MAKIGRNDPCPCGSGRKYKQCCLARDEQGMTTQTKILAGIIGIVLVAGAILAVTWDSDTEQRRVWSEEHGHWHTVP